MKRTLLRNKNKSYPKDPKSIENIRDKFKEAKVFEEYGYNLDSDARFYIGTVVEEDFAFTIFASHYVINFIERNIEPDSRNYLMDGTFDSLPNEYCQLLIISIEYKNDVSSKFQFL